MDCLPKWLILMSLRSVNTLMHSVSCSRLRRVRLAVEMVQPCEFVITTVVGYHGVGDGWTSVRFLPRYAELV